MFKKIVWATDGSAGADHALGYARDLARTTGAEHVVVHSEEMSAARSSIGYTRRVDEEDLEAKINRQVSEITEGGIPVSVTAIGGHAHPGTLIADVAENVGADEMEMVGGIRGHFPSRDAVADLGQALESLPEQWNQGFTTICVKPSMFINDARDLPKFCRSRAAGDKPHRVTVAP